MDLVASFLALHPMFSAFGSALMSAICTRPLVANAKVIDGSQAPMTFVFHFERNGWLPFAGPTLLAFSVSAPVSRLTNLFYTKKVFTMGNSRNVTTECPA